MDHLKFTDEIQRAVSEVLTDLLSTESGKADAERVGRYTNLVEATLNENLRYSNENGGSELVVVEGMVKTIFRGPTVALRSILQKWLWAYKRAEQNIVSRIREGYLSGSPVTSFWYAEGYIASCWLSEFAWGRRYLHFREFNAEMDRVYAETNSVEYVAQELGLSADAARMMLYNRRRLVWDEYLPELDDGTRHRVTLAIAAWSLKKFPDAYDEEDDWFVD